MINKSTAAMLLALTFASVPAFAQDNTPRIDHREDHQANRIEQGMDSGALTPRETARVDRGQARVQAEEAHAKADGKVTAHERARITRAQNHQSHVIKHLKHNDRATS
jgi:hypothetical protein